MLSNQNLISEETSLMDSSYADFHDVYKKIKKRQEQNNRKLKGNSSNNNRSTADNGALTGLNSPYLPSSLI